MSTTIDWIIDTATGGTLLSAVGLLVLAVLRRPGIKQRWGEAVLAACILAALITLIPGRPKLTLSLIHLVGNLRQSTPAGFHGVHIGPLAGGHKVARGGMAARVKSSAVGRNGHGSFSVGAAHMFTAFLNRDALTWLKLIYLSGAFFMLLRVVLGQWLLWRLRITAIAPPEPVRRQWQYLLDDLPGRQAGRQPRLLVSSHITGPLTFGIWNPLVLIPPDLCDGEHHRERQAVLLHELAHIRRHDALAEALAVTATIVFFYQPLLWWLRRKVRLYREYMADTQAAAGMASPGEYARCLLELARAGGGNFGGAGLANGLISSHSEFYQRMRQLLRNSTLVNPEPAASTKWMLLGAGTLVLATSSITLRAGAGWSMWTASTTEVAARPAVDAVAIASSAANPRMVTDRGVAYLLHHQGRQGQWLGRYGPAVTALVVKALVESGQPLSAAPVRRGLAFMESCRQPDGGFYSASEPLYNTAIVVSTLAALPTPRFHQQIRHGLRFLQAAQAAAPASRRHGQAAWFGGRQINSALNDDQTIEALRAAGLPASDAAVQQAVALLRQSSSSLQRELDPHERPSGTVLENYALLTYAQLKSMIYAGLSRSDPRVQHLIRWIRTHYTLRFNPARHSARGRYYYYLTFAKALRAYGLTTITDAAGVRHNWRRDLYRRLARAQEPNGSWVNHGSSEYLEGNPIMATTYAVLTLEEINKPMQ